MDFLHVVTGAVVGFVIGLTGVGGGSLMTPILVLGFGINPAIAVGTDLLYAAITKCGGVFFHNRNRTIDWKIVGLLASGSIPMSILTIFGLEWLTFMNLDYERIMMLTLSIMLICTSLVVIFKNRLLSYIHGTVEISTILTKRQQRIRTYLTILCGSLLGFVVTVSSVGAGAIGAAILFLLYPSKHTTSIVGTDIAHAVPLTAIAGIGHIQLGSVDFHLLGGLLVGGLPAIYLGSHIGKTVPDSLLRPVVASVLFVLGLRFAF